MNYDRDYDINESKKYNIAIVGATGAVGATLLYLLIERSFPFDNVYAVASSRSAGTKLNFGYDPPMELIVEDLETFSFEKVDIAIFSIGSKLSSEYAPKAALAGCIVIDNSSYWRMNDDIPLVVASVNSECISQYKNKYIISNPNCIVAPLVDVLHPLNKIYGVKRIILSTYQSVSGKGNRAIRQLFEETRDDITQNYEENLNNNDDINYDENNFNQENYDENNFNQENYNENCKKTSNKKIEEENENYEESDEFSGVLPHKIAFNVIPQVGEILSDGETEEEEKIRNEIQKILCSQIGISATCVRVPVFFGHSIAANIELSVENIPSIDEIADVIKNNKDVIISHDIDHNYSTNYIMPIDCVSLPFVYVSRLRPDYSNSKAFNIWIVSDNLYKGAALNALQIAEKLITTHL
ncbi:aspartate-semialdehyde dehydrogenase [Lyticum sinuosum]|uniref:aspartate-semialdehyde dehydrogenase n=1 Tax=Lyticum sinuosum TaxID=1332059 RepID=A0AAE4VJZ4_9RICK|nr:aspartate-semialdehyde dehydrogenase [Lyticum sinuosum]MDZ5761331.1 Aspartate-semialdehyde dehydrogenase 2 [Lyticum sinuosum]